MIGRFGAACIVGIRVDGHKADAPRDVAAAVRKPSRKDERC